MREKTVVGTAMMEYNSGMGNAQPALAIDQLVDETRDIRRMAFSESGFHRELVNQIRVQAVYRALKSLPLSPQVHNVFGRVFCLKGDEYGARKHHQQAISMEPSNPAHYVDYGVTLEMFGRFDEAATAYMSALKRSPHDLTALDYVVKALRILQRYDEAAPYLDALIKLKPDDSELQMEKEMLMDRLFPEERFRESFVKKVELAAREVESGHAPTFNSIEDMDTYLTSRPHG